jgi:hypothetical protein
MTNAESGPQAAPLDGSPRASFWIRELPYILVFILTILGVASCGRRTSSPQTCKEIG